MNLLRRLLPGISLVLGAFLLSIGIQTLAAWTPPGGSPPGSNAYAPLNTGPDTQTKSGALNVTGSVGIGTAAPGAKLEVAGQVKITGGVPGAGKVLTSDASGLATWTAPASSGVTGSGSTNYLSKWTGASSLGNSLIYDNGTNIGIGTASPSEKLHVAGSLYVGNNWYKAGNITAVNNAIGAWSAAGGMIAGFPSGIAVAVGGTTAGGYGIGISNGAIPQGAFYYIPGEVGVGNYVNSGASILKLYSENPAGFGASGILLNKNQTIELQTGQQSRLFIASSGNVGIGTTNPSEKLTVGDGSGYYRILVPRGQIWIRDSGYSGSTLALNARNIETSNNEDLYLNWPNASGNITIGGEGESKVLYLAGSNGARGSGSYVDAPDYYIRSIGQWATVLSDGRLKTNIVPLSGVLDKLQNIRGVSFDWNDAYYTMRATSTKEARQIGMVAQEMEQQYPELVGTSSNGYKFVDYKLFSAVLLEGIKELKAENESLKARTGALEKRIEILEAR